jgi:transcriptional regulator with XRE-family HTH domain
MAMELERRRDVAQRIRDLRHARRPRPTQQDIADAMDITLRAYQAWESGESTPEWSNLAKLADFYGVAEDYILNGDEPVEATSIVVPEITRALAAILSRLDALDGRMAAVEAATSHARTDEPEERRVVIPDPETSPPPPSVGRARGTSRPGRRRAG